MKTLLSSLLLCLSAATLLARIGETPAQIVERFGEPSLIEKESKTMGWDLDGIFYVVVFDGQPARSVLEFLSTEFPNKISTVQKTRFLEANGTGWYELKPRADLGWKIRWKNYTFDLSFTQKRYTNDTGDLMAVVTTSGQMISVGSAAGVDRITANARQRDEDAAVDF